MPVLGARVGLVAAVVIASVALIVRLDGVGTGPLTSAKASPTALPTAPAASVHASPLASKLPTPDPGAAWTSLAWSEINGGPAGSIAAVVPRGSGANVVVATNAGPKAWRTDDFVTWTMAPDAFPSSSTVTAVVARGDTLVAIGTDTSDGVPCPQGGPCPALIGAAWQSTDGATWVEQSDPFAGIPITAAATANVVIVAVPRQGGGAALYSSATGTAWQPRVLPPAMSAAWITTVAASGGNLVALGYEHSPTARAIAWWSPDGTTWSPAPVTIPAGTGASGFDAVHPGRLGMIATTFTPEAVPGLTRWWRSASGRSWKLDSAGSPFGSAAAGSPLAGQPIGQLSSDGNRIVVLAANTSVLRGAVSVGDGHWDPLTIGGPPAGVGSGAFEFWVVPSGILASDGTSTWFGRATGR